MTTEPWPGQAAEPAESDWAFRARRPTDSGQQTEVPGQPVPHWDQVAPPTAEPAGSDAPPPPPVARRRGRGPWIVAALLVLAAAGGGAAMASQRQSGDPVASKHLAGQWQVPVSATGDELIGSWLTDTLLVRASTHGGLTAYRLDDGTVAWHATPRGSGGAVPCAMSPSLAGSGPAGAGPAGSGVAGSGTAGSGTAGSGVGTVAFGADANSCTTLAGVDASTGRILWTLPLVDAAHRTATAAGTYVQGGVVTVVSENILGGVDLRTGRRVWGFHGRGDYCNAYDWGGTGVVLVDDYCADSTHQFTLTAYDAEAGTKLWQQAQSTHLDIAHIFSSSPLIASVHTAQEDSVRVYDASGRSRKLAVGNTELTPGNGTAADHAARIVGDVLVTPAQSAQGAEIVGFDIHTGAQLWTHHGGILATVAPGDDHVYVVTDSATPQLLQLDPRTGRSTAVAALPTPPGGTAFGTGTVYVTPTGAVLELDALATRDGVRAYR